MSRKVSAKVKAQRRENTRRARARARENGGVIVYGMLTSPDAIAAWKALQKMYGSNRDALEAAIADAYENLKDGYTLETT